MENIIYKKEKSFTLIELLVSITIFVLVVAAAIGIFVSSLQGKQRVNQLKEIEDNARFAMEMMSREIRMGNIDDNEAVTPADEQIEFISSNGDSVVYYLSGTELKKIINSGSAKTITSNRIRVTNLKFYVNDFSTGVDQPRVTISMTVEAANNSLVKMDFQTTISPKYDNS